jgi:hypothetical protein
MIVSYRHRPKAKRQPNQPAKIAAAIVTARQPKKYQRKAIDPVVDPAADARVAVFFKRMGLTVPTEGD